MYIIISGSIHPIEDLKVSSSCSGSNVVSFNAEILGKNQNRYDLSNLGKYDLGTLPNETNLNGLIYGILDNTLAEVLNSYPANIRFVEAAEFITKFEEQMNEAVESVRNLISLGQGILDGKGITFN